MKSYAWIPFVLLFGLVVGGWGTQSELRKEKTEIEELRRQLRTQGAAKGAAGVRDVTRMLGIGSEGGRASAAPKAGDRAESRDAQQAGQETAAGVPGNRPEGTNAVAKPARTPEEKAQMERDIDRAMELWKVRSDIARTAFITAADLNKEQTVKFDVLVAAMNMRLQNGISNWVESVKEKPEIGAEEGIRLVNDVTESLVVTYNEFDRTMPPKWRLAGKDSEDRQIEIMDFIDPAVAKPLVAVEGKMNGARWHQGRGGSEKEPGEKGSP